MVEADDFGKLHDLRRRAVSIGVAMLTRRALLRAGGLVCAGFVARRARPAEVLEIRMRTDPRGQEVWFDPIGWVKPPPADKGRAGERAGTATIPAVSASPRRAQGPDGSMARSFPGYDCHRALPEASPDQRPMRRGECKT